MSILDVPVPLRHTALHDVHVRAGASFTDFAGWDMPVRYSSELEEHHAVRRAAGLFDLSHMGQIQVVGPGAGEALDAALVGWISKIAVGKAKYTMMCSEAGGIVDDLVVYRTGHDEFLVVANASNHASVLAVLMRHDESAGVSVVDRSRSDALIAVQGPESLAILQLVTAALLDTLKYYSILSAEIRHVPVKIARTGYTGEDGFEIYLNSREAVHVWDTLMAAGASRGLRPAGLACRDTLRLEAGMPLYGNELTSGTSPFDAGLGRVVAVDKPHDFTGREALEWVSTHPSDRVLVGVALEGRRVARPGQTILMRGSDEPVGAVTSGAPSPTLGHPIAMAYVDSRFATIGTELAVDVRGRREAASVVALPFYRRPR